MKLNNNKILKHLTFSLFILGFCASFTSSLFAVEGEANRVYLYVGSNGEVVINDYIPPEFLSKGYSILTSKGMLVEKIAPELTAEQRASLSVEVQEKEKKKERAKRVSWLLERYSDASDAVLARDRQLSAIDTIIIVAQNNIKKLKQEESKELAFAARDEREGREVSAPVLKSINGIRSSISDAEQLIEEKRSEKEKVTTEFHGIIEEMKVIEARRKR